jgi:hypothetical protein
MSRVSRRLVFAQGLDALTFIAFYALVHVSVHAERNPLIVALMALGGVQAVGLFKVGIAMLVARRHDRRPAIALSRRYVAIRTVLISAGTASGIVGAAFNLASIANSLWGWSIRL